MKSIIEQLCKGEVEYVSLKLPKDRLEKEMSYYDKIKALMTGENTVLFDEYVDTVALNYAVSYTHLTLPTILLV